jgi:hypothetical protein
MMKLDLLDDDSGASLKAEVTAQYNNPDAADTQD